MSGTPTALLKATGIWRADRHSDRIDDLIAKGKPEKLPWLSEDVEKERNRFLKYGEDAIAMGICQTIGTAQGVPRPHLTSPIANLVSSTATLRSHCIASMKPPPVQIPLIAPITGFMTLAG